MDKTVDEQRQSVVVEAMSWLNTPYHPGARLKGIGADCLTYVVGVYENLGLIRKYEVPYYPRDWHLHQEEERLMNGVREFCDEVVREPLPGDVVLWKFGLTYAHATIVIAWPRVIHAYLNRSVREDDVSKALWLSKVGERGPLRGKSRPSKLFTLRSWV